MKRNGNMMRAYSDIQAAYAERLEKGDEVKEFQCNVLLDGLEEGEYTSDFLCVKAVLILSMTATAIGGGVAVVKEAYKKTTQKAEAQQVLATTAELITDVLSQAQEVRTGGTSGPEFFNGENGIWMRLGAVPYQEADGTQEENTNKAGICKVFIADNGQETRVPLLSDGAMAKRFYTDFNVDQYSYEDGCFTVKDINVYYKADAKRSDKVPMAHLDQLTVHAVNLEGLN